MVVLVDTLLDPHDLLVTVIFMLHATSLALVTAFSLVPFSLHLGRNDNAHTARRTHHRTQQRVPRRLERALLHRRVEVLQLVVAELLEHLRHERQRRVRAVAGRVLREHRFECAQLATSGVSNTVTEKTQRRTHSS